MRTNSLVVKFILGIVFAAVVGPGCIFAQQTGTPSQQTPSPAPSTRPPDPARSLFAPSAQFTPPENLAFRTANITSEGVRLHAELLSLKSLAGKPLPTIIMAHGWGGVAANFRRDAMDFANAGYLVITFDYRGWGESDARLVLTRPSPIKPIPGQNQKFTAEVIEVREYVDPLEQTTDWFNVINWAVGEPNVDKDRIGIRGSSYSGGHVFYVAALDPRIKAVVSQVGAFDSRWVVTGKAEQDLTNAEATKHAHGEPYPAPRAVTVGRLIGAPIRESLTRYAPIDLASKVKDPAVLFIVAEKEELFSNDEHAKLAYDRMPGTKKKYISIPNITHYGVYREQREQAVKYAIEWYDQYLKK
ncbi:MAG: alpha/beta fold hydrolase [Acidobacteriota bacterium]